MEEVAWPSSDFRKKNKPFFQQKINTGAYLSSFALLRVAKNLRVPIHTQNLQLSVKGKLTPYYLLFLKYFDTQFKDFIYENIWNFTIWKHWLT